MSLGNTTENDFCELIFKATALPWAAASNLYVSLHTADPLDTGTQLTSEANYGSYDRVTVARSGSGWTVTANQAINAALVQFPQCTSGSSNATHVAIGTAAYASAGQILASGALTTPLNVSTGIQPQFSAGALTFTID